MSERTVETQVIEFKARTADAAAGVSKLEIGATKAKAALELAKQRLDALNTAQKKFGPPTEIEHVRDEVRRLGEEAKLTQAKVVAASKAEAAASKAAAASEKALAREAAAAGRERAKAARDAARAITAAEREAAKAAKESSEQARAAMADRVDDAKKYERALAAARTEAERLTAAQGAWRSKVGPALGGLARGAAGGAARALGAGALAAVGGAAAIGGGAFHEIVTRGSEFAAQREALSSKLGGRQQADERIAELRGIRGLSTGDGIAATNRLEGLGLNSSAGSVKALASIAAGTPGKNVNDVTEALADAATGETERLKEFGIKAKVVGDQFQVTFKGITTTIEKGSESWQKYLNGIAASDFGETLELRANSLAGQVEHLQDKITQAASAVYDSGLGDAVKAVVADIGSYFEVSGEGAKGLGGVLGEAVKKLWARIKELIGPVGELPDKIRKVIETAMSFAEVAMKIVGVLSTVVETLGTTNTAFVALGAAGLAALGPWGAAAAAAVIAISTIADALRDTTAEARKLAEQTARVAQTEVVKKQLSGELGEDEENVARLRKGLQDRKNANKRSGSRSMSPESIKRDAEKRLADQAEIAAQETLIAEAEARIGKKKRDAQKAIDDEAERVRKEELAASDAESQKISDAEEFTYLSRKKNKRPSDKKRLAELSKKLDKSIPGKAGKAKHSALGEEIESEIKKRSQDAGRVAGLRALHGGAGAKEADAVAMRTEKEVAERLRGQVDKGGLLPGQVNAGLLALARVDEVAGRGTPPPIAVTNLGPITINPTVNVTGNKIDADLRQIEIGTRRIVKDVMVEESREALRRIASKVQR